MNFASNSNSNGEHNKAFDAITYSNDTLMQLQHLIILAVSGLM